MGAMHLLKGATALAAIVSATVLTSGCTNLHSLDSERSRLGISCRAHSLGELGEYEVCTDKQGNECRPLDDPQLWNCQDPTTGGWDVQYPPE